MPADIKESLKNFQLDILKRIGLDDDCIEDYLKEIKEDITAVRKRAYEEIAESESGILYCIDEIANYREEIQANRAVLALCNLHEEK